MARIVLVHNPTAGGGRHRPAGGAVAARLASAGHEVVEAGSVYDVFSTPLAPTTQRFVSSVLHHVPTADALERARDGAVMSASGQPVLIEHPAPQPGAG